MSKHFKRSFNHPIKKAIIPAAGFGTRLLPATKAQPKEMLPVVDKPVIQYVVEEAVHSGIRKILFVVAEGKEVLKEHFRQDEELENFLREKGKLDELKIIHSLNHLADIELVYQQEQKGLGDAILCAEEFVQDEPFAVLLGDTITANKGKPLTLQLAEIFSTHRQPVVALEEVKPALAHRYGIFAGEKIGNRLFRAKQLIEKPRGKAPSNLAIAGRYVLTSAVFDYLKKIPPGVNNEIQLTDAMRLYLEEAELHGYLFNGNRYDVGNRLDFIKTNIELGLKNKEIAAALRTWMKQLLRKN